MKIFKKPDTDLKVALVHMLVGAIIGILMPFINSNIIALFFAMAILYATGQTTERVFKLTENKEKYNFKWWLANGVYPYIIFWLLLWVIFLNQTGLFNPIG